MMQFKAFKPEGLNKIAGAMGYKGDMSKFQDFIEQDPARMARMNMFTQAAQQMARGGMVNMQTGGFVPFGIGNLNTFTQNATRNQAAVDAFNKRQQAQMEAFNLNQQAQLDALNSARNAARNAALENAAKERQALAANTVVDPRLAAEAQAKFGPAPTQEQALKQAREAGMQPSQRTGDDSGPIQLANYTPPTQETYTTVSENQAAQEAASPAMSPYTVYGPDGTAYPTPASARAAGVTDYTNTPPGPSITEESISRMFNPALPTGGVTYAATVPTADSQDIATGTGEVSGVTDVPVTMASTSTASPAAQRAANKYMAAQTANAVDTTVSAAQAAQANTRDPRLQITAAQQAASSVGNLKAAQGNAFLISNPTQRQIQNGELISGAANAQKAAQFTEQIQAAEATPSQQATVQGQLAQLTQNFDAANPPAWAAGALRNANAQMAERGLGASSLAGQAIVQATLEAALPIAQADAKTIASFEAQNLSNRQQRSMLAAEQRAVFMGQEFDQAFQARVQNAARIADAADKEFTADQQILLENSKLANTMNMQNLSNRQALVIAEASALANMDLSNLNNRQQAAVENAQSFLQVDLANLSNRQQTELFKNQQRVQSLLTDQAATNASRQFNATSQNQVDQFFANLSSQISQFNAAQRNGQSQFNAGQANTVERFNAEMNNQRDIYNAQAQKEIAQFNAVWRREIATADTAAVNRANELNANAILDISKTAYDNLWSYFSDTMEWAWKSAESELDRIANVAIAEIDAKNATATAKLQSSGAAKASIGNLIGTLGAAAISKWCYVAREVYGPHNTDWVRFRIWIMNDAPKWFKWMYGEYGELVAKFISNKPKVKSVIKYFMDKVVRKYK